MVHHHPRESIHHNVRLSIIDSLYTALVILFEKRNENLRFLLRIITIPMLSSPQAQLYRFHIRQLTSFYFHPQYRSYVVYAMLTRSTWVNV